MWPLIELGFLYLTHPVGGLMDELIHWIGGRGDPRVWGMGIPGRSGWWVARGWWRGEERGRGWDRDVVGGAGRVHVVVHVQVKSKWKSRLAFVTMWWGIITQHSKCMYFFKLKNLTTWQSDDFFFFANFQLHLTFWTKLTCQNIVWSTSKSHRVSKEPKVKAKLRNHHLRLPSSSSWG